MAKPVLSMDQMQQQEAELASQEAAASAKANNSSTFWSDNTPSTADVLADIRLRDIAKRKEKLQSNIIARDTYGLPTNADVNTVNQPKEGFISKTLNKLSTPLYGVVGTASYIAGKGENTLGESIATGIKNKETWGGLLRKVGVTPKVSMVAGFGLDVLTDPVNLLSGGMVGASRGTLGKIVAGVGKKGAAQEATKLGGLKILNTISKFVPGLDIDKAALKAVKGLEADANKVAKEMVDKGFSVTSPEYISAMERFSRISPEYTAAMRKAIVPSENAVGRLIGKARVARQKLLESIKNSSDRYDSLTNFDLERTTDIAANKQSIFDIATEKLKEMGPSSVNKVTGEVKTLGQKAADLLIYDPYGHSVAAKAMDEIEYGFAKQGLQIKKGGIDPTTGMFFEPTLEGVAKKTDLAFEAGKNIPEVSYFDPLHPDIPVAREGILKSIDDSVEMLNKGDKLDLPDTLHAADAMQQEAINQASLEKWKIAWRETLKQDKLGEIETLNKAISKGLGGTLDNKKWIKGVFDFYDITRGLFIASKITSLSPSSLMYAILGNPTMALMYGFDITHPDNITRMKDAIHIIFQRNTPRSAEVYKWMTNDPMMVDLFNRRPKSFIDNFGINLRSFVLGETATDVVNKSEKLGSLKGYGDIRSKEKLASDLKESLQSANLKAVLKSTPSQDWKTTGAQTITEGRNPTGMAQFANENLNAFSRFKDSVSKTAIEGTGLKQKAAKAANWYFARSADFQKVDQAFKLKDFFRMTRDGITEKEILKITNNFVATNARLFKGDIYEAVWKGGTKYYKIKPEVAMDIASDMYMNYAAMPGFVKIMRNLPIIGSPFYAFTYGMMAKTAKAAVNNTAVFNKVNFFLEELSQDKSPLEREALKSKYYSYLDKPGMVNLGENFPFFKGHPIYLNMTQMVPYYSLNIINPSERGFNDDFRGKVSEFIDKSPFFKDPLGQIMLDYVILPTMMRDQRPVNMWGGPLYEQDASKLKQVAYAARSFGESMTPSFPSALVAGSGVMTDEQLKWFPSYPGRAVGFGVQGKTNVGTIGTEDPASRGNRKWASIFGINFYPIDLQNVSTEIKSRQK